MFFSDARCRRRLSRRGGVLRDAVAAMPAATAAAMLTGLDAGTDVICGRYTHDGHPCPILLASRHGAPAIPTGFAGAWDHVCAARPRRPRLARPREVALLRDVLAERIMPRCERHASQRQVPGHTRLQVVERAGAERVLLHA